MVEVREFGGIPSDGDVFGQEAEQHNGGNSRGYLANWKESSQLWQTRSHSNKGNTLRCGRGSFLLQFATGLDSDGVRACNVKSNRPKTSKFGVDLLLIMRIKAWPKSFTDTEKGRLGASECLLARISDFQASGSVVT